MSQTGHCAHDPVNAICRFRNKIYKSTAETPPVSLGCAFCGENGEPIDKTLMFTQTGTWVESDADMRRDLFMDQPSNKAIAAASTSQRTAWDGLGALLRLSAKGKPSVTPA
jgi:hypothetical protein